MWNPGGSEPFSTINMVIANVLAHRLPLCQAGGRHDDADGRRHGAQAGHRQLAPHDHHHDPRVDLSMASSDTRAAATSSLVGDGIEERPRVVTWFRRLASIPSASR